MNRERAISVLRSNLERIRSFGVVSIGIFGSTVRNQATDTSDLDVLVEFEPAALRFDNYMDLKFLLESLFSCKVDLVTTTSIKPALRKRILSEVVYAA